jgi:hypothetical protein
MRREREAEGNINDYDTCTTQVEQRARWQSDWNGDEVGWDHVDVVGLYDIFIDGKWQSCYIDAQTGDLLEILEPMEDE